MSDDICYARTYVEGEIKGTHKPAPGMYDGKLIISCVWCGKTLSDLELDVSTIL